MCTTALLSSCGIHSSYERPKDIKAEANLYRNTVSVDTANFGNRPWREVFTDNKLQQLIERALDRNADLQTAELKIKEAEATYLPAKMAFLPNLALNPSGTISSFDGGKTTQSYKLPIVANWQLDVFGSLRNAKQMAKAQILQSRAYKQAVQTQIIGGVANMYYTLLMLDEQLRITKETAEIWKQNVEAMRSMLLHSTMTNVAAVSQSEANYHAICASIPAIEQNIHETENSLSVFLHDAPQRIERTALDAQLLPSDLSIGIPMQLLSNRPDVQTAEMALRLAFYNTNYARSKFYPNITLSGSAGWVNSVGQSILNPGKVLASAVASLTQPLFANGQLVGQLRIAKAQQEEAKIGFEQSLLNAGKEVSDALFAYQVAEEKTVSRKQQVVSLEKANEATKELFKLGTTSYLETLTAQQSLLSARLSLVNDEFSKMQSVVNLYSALGGGRDQ